MMLEATALDERLPLVRAENLGCVFDVSQPWLNRVIERTPRRLLTAAAEVSFAIDRNETFALVGESGSGKSTVAKMCVGLLRPSSGEVFIDGVSMSDRRQEAKRRLLRRRIQMIFQDPYASLNPRWRTGDIIAEPLRAFRLVAGRHARGERIAELLRLVGLDPADAAKFPHEFSGGQRQRIAIARALASQPEFIVCDEPTSALDVSVQAQILNLMRDLQARFGLTYLFISHNLAVVRHMADRIGVMYLGRLVETAPARELFARPRHPYTRMLLDAVPDLDLTGRSRKPVEGEVPNPITPPAGCPFHPRCPHAFARCRTERPQPLAAGASLVACHAVEEGRIGPGMGPAAPARAGGAIDPVGAGTYTSRA
jgi:peptide/nickel transport system ATP-binding protein